MVKGKVFPFALHRLPSALYPFPEEFMDNEKERQEISLIGRIFSLEALLIVMGLLSLVSGIIRMQRSQIFWGLIIILGSVLLIFVRKKKRWGK